MSDLPSVIEANENRWMRAWIGRDTKTLKALTSRKFRLVIGSKPAVMLDARSWLEAAPSRFTCDSYRFGDIYSRAIGNVVVFATQLEMRAELERQDWSGQFWMTDLWAKSPVRRTWQMVERSLSRLEVQAEIPAAAKALQLWK